MSRENVELVRRIYERTAQGHPEVIYETLDPDVVWDASASGMPEAGVYRGHEQVAAYRRRFWGAWETPRNEPEELIDAGENVVALVRMGGRGKGSGVEVEQPFAMVWTLSAGKVTRVALYRDRGEALEAVGLRE
jgi:ketosteroid isomerase-like protein